MAGLLRDGCRSPSRRQARRSCRALVEYVPVGLPPPSLLDQLVCDMQRHLEEMERVRAVLLDAYPCLAACAPAASGSSGSSGAPAPPRGRRASRRPSEDAEDEPPRDYEFPVDVAGFAPEQLAVRLEGRRLTVTCKHDRRSEAADGCVSREYREVRKELRLPPDADLDGLVCTLAPDGDCLCVRAPRLQGPPAAERSVPVGLPGKPPDAALGPAPAAGLPPAPPAPAPPPAADAPAAPAA